MSIENLIDASEIQNVERTDRIIIGLLYDSIEETIRVNLETVNSQILTLTQLFNEIIQDNSAKNTPTADPCTHHPQGESSFSRETAASRTLLGTAMGVTNSRSTPDEEPFAI